MAPALSARLKAVATLLSMSACVNSAGQISFQRPAYCSLMSHEKGLPAPPEPLNGMTHTARTRTPCLLLCHHQGHYPCGHNAQGEEFTSGAWSVSQCYSILLAV